MDTLKENKQIIKEESKPVGVGREPTAPGPYPAQQWEKDELGYSENKPTSDHSCQCDQTEVFSTESQLLYFCFRRLAGQDRGQYVRGLNNALKIVADYRQ
ncbi:hypothetical protein ElyMa_006984700 [Elysia marginata]|uniref:Uncharacterized protein n=1 Tax=Elysia marginata TaxID=1093978 RepID=A0AAV4JMU7_9GAST|nr:hypothetical protein ElyMa_006984700 [Elysia marginata]